MHYRVHIVYTDCERKNKPFHFVHSLSCCCYFTFYCFCACPVLVHGIHFSWKGRGQRMLYLLTSIGFYWFGPIVQKIQRNRFTIIQCFVELSTELVWVENDFVKFFKHNFKEIGKLLHGCDEMDNVCALWCLIEASISCVDKSRLKKSYRRSWALS